METFADEVQYLRRCIRDLVAFTTLPAIWTGRKPQMIAESLAEVLLHTLRLNIVYVRVQGSQDEDALEAARAERHPEVANQAPAIGRALAPWLTAARSDSPPSIPNPTGNGMVRLAIIPIGYEGGYGMVAAGSQQSDFPTELDRLLLNVGANQVAAWVQEARLLATLQRSEEAERIQRKYFQTTLASIGDAIIVTNPEGVITFLNQVTEDVTGWTTAEATGKPLLEVFRLKNEESRQSEENPVTQVSREGGVDGSVNHAVLIRKDGSACSIDDSTAPILNEQGRILGMILVFRDITARKQAQDALREREQELADFFDNATVGLHWVGPDGIILRVNQAELDLLGYMREEYVGHHIAEFHDDPAVIQDILQRLTSGEILQDYSARLRCKDGSLKDVLIDSSVLRKEGRFLHTRCFTRDITARKQAEAALAESEERWRTLAEALPALVWMARADGFLDYYNQRWYDYTGMTAEQLAGWGWQAVWHPEDLPDGRARWQESLRTGQPYEYEARLRRVADASYRWHLIRAVPVRDREGLVLRWFGTNTDIEEQKHMVAELQRVNAELQQFAHIVSHDLSEPLRTISNFLQLFMGRSPTKLDAEDKDYLTFVTDGAQRMQTMISALLEYTRVGGQAITRVPVDCEALLVRVVRGIQLAVAESHATVTHDSLPTVLADETRLGQVFQNLIANALKFRSQAPLQIHIAVERTGNYWRFAVRDNGIGIDPRQTNRLFQVFQRLHTRSEYPGTGIGLAICRKIIERHGGRIWVESTPGEGATFFFTVSGGEEAVESRATSDKR